MENSFVITTRPRESVLHDTDSHVGNLPFSSVIEQTQDVVRAHVLMYTQSFGLVSYGGFIQ